MKVGDWFDHILADSHHKTVPMATNQLKEGNKEKHVASNIKVIKTTEDVVSKLVTIPMYQKKETKRSNVFWNILILATW